MSKESHRYQQWQKEQERAWEAKCLRCGACCGVAEGDPCENLEEVSSGKYICRIYEHRFGLRKTINGKEFLCVPIRKILHETWPGDECCGYKKGTLTS